MTLQLAGGGRFGSVRRPQVAWAGLEGDVAALSALAARLTAAARTLRLPVEDRPFKAHLTLGRWRPRQPADGALTDRLAGYRGPVWPVTEVRLLESHLGPAGPAVGPVPRLAPSVRGVGRTGSFNYQAYSIGAGL